MRRGKLHSISKVATFRGTLSYTRWHQQMQAQALAAWKEEVVVNVVLSKRTFERLSIPRYRGMYTFDPTYVL